MKNDKSVCRPRSPEEIRRLAKEWCRMPMPPIHRLFAWRYSMRWADAASFYVRSDSDWWQKATAICPDRHRLLLMAAAFVGECYRKHRRLRGEWVRCDVSDCPERAGCPCWRVYFAYDRTTDCVFKDFLSRKGAGPDASERLRRPAEANERKKEDE